MANGPKTIRVLMVNNGAIGWAKVVDFGSFLGLRVDKDKWLAWAKGKPLLMKGGFGSKRYTYLVTPEIAWSLDGDSIVNIMAKAKALAYPQFKGRAVNAPELSDSPIAQKVDLQPPEKPLTREEVADLIGSEMEKLRATIQKELVAALQGPKHDEGKVPGAPTVPPPSPMRPQNGDQKKSEPEQRAPSVPAQPSPLPSPAPQLSAKPKLADPPAGVH